MELYSMEHAFKIDLFPLLLLVHQYFLGMSQFGPTCSRVVKKQGVGTGKLYSHKTLTMLCDVGMCAALASGDERVETCSSTLGSVCLQATS